MKIKAWASMSENKRASERDETVDLTNLEKMRLIEWFNYVRSKNPAHLDEVDFEVAKKIRKQLLDGECA